MKQSLFIILIFTAVWALASSAFATTTATAVTVQVASHTGVSLSLTTLEDGDDYEFVNTGAMLLLVENTGGTTCTLTVVTGGTFGGFALADRTVVLAPGALVVVGPLNTQYYNDPNGRVRFRADAAGVRAAVVRAR